MERICEPELMDGLEQVEAYAAADFSASDQAMVERLALLCGDAPGLRLLDLGCGPGNISFLLAHRWPQARVLGIDGAARMIAMARARLALQPDLQSQLVFEQARLPLSQPLPPGSPLAAGFTALVTNSLLHHLHQPAALWQSLPALAAPGAFVYVQDLRRPASPAALEALVASEMADAPAVLEHDYRASLRAAFTPAEVRQQLDQAGLAGLEVAPLRQRYLEVWGRLAG